MTGFGRAEGVVGGKKISVELRSLNSKQLDLQMKLPAVWREKEAALRLWAAPRVVRGKAEFSMATEAAGTQKRTLFRADLARAYYQELTEMAHHIDPRASTDIMGLVLRLPDVAAMPTEQLDPLEWEQAMQLVEQAWTAFDRFRAGEGGKLAGELKARTKAIQHLLAEVEGMDAGRIERTRSRIMAKLEEWRAKLDMDRVEQEMVFYIEKLDVSEEKMRLATHCEYFLGTIDAEENQGRKLGFIAQEMGREINTLGSKANDARMQKHVVMMKDELEKIKEQVLNVL